MAAALPDGGRIDACELDPERAAFAQRFFDRSPHGSKITLHIGPALETVRGLEGEFDFVFIDAEKEGYVGYYEEVLPRLSERGLIVADNTLGERPRRRRAAADRARSTSTSPPTRAACRCSSACATA